MTFTNAGDMPHTATAFDKGKDGNWDTGPLAKGESKTITFDKPAPTTTSARRTRGCTARSSSRITEERHAGTWCRPVRRRQASQTLSEASVTTTTSTGSVRRTKAGQEMVEGEEESCERGRTGPRIRETGNQSQMSPTDAPRGAPCPCAVVTPGRRALLAAGVGIGVDLAARVAGAQSDAAHARPKGGDLLVKVGDTTPLGPDSLSIGEGQVMAWPMDPAEKVVRDGSRLNKVLLVKLDPATLDQQTKERAASGWSGPTRQSVPTPDVRWSTGPPSARFSRVRATTLNMIPRQVRASSLARRRAVSRRCLWALRMES